MTDRPFAMFIAPLPDGGSLTVVCRCGSGMAPDQHSRDCTAYIRPPCPDDEPEEPTP